MNKAVFKIGMVLTVFAMLVGIATTPALAHVDVYVSPDPTTCSLAPGENMTLQLIAELDANETNGLKGFQVGIDYNPAVINVTNAENPCLFASGGTCYVRWWRGAFEWDNTFDGGPYGQMIWFYGRDTEGYGPGIIPLANFTIERVGSGDICKCISPRYFTHETRYEPTIGSSRLATKQNTELPRGNISWHDTFEKGLCAGWNLISLPFIPEDNSTSSVLASVWDNVSGSVYKYNAATKQFESVTTMEPGVGYFVYLTSDDIWIYNTSTTYPGYPENYKQMNVWLEPGLNMVGWLSWPKNVSDVLTSGDHWYATTFNASEQKYTDTFNPVAPDVFNRLTKMEPGAGYFISAKHGCWLNVSC